MSINPIIYVHQGMNGVYWPASINPYRRGSTPPHRLWLRGWRAARAERARRKRR